ncbi:MAG: histidine kinase [Rhizobiales bacterium]|nr:histidine kinase [Hyphomicrobiales bacterium]
MPSLFRFLFVILLLGGLGLAGVLALAYLVQPTEREMTISVPSKRLNP